MEHGGPDLTDAAEQRLFAAGVHSCSPSDTHQMDGDRCWVALAAATAPADSCAWSVAPVEASNFENPQTAGAVPAEAVEHQDYYQQPGGP